MFTQLSDRLEGTLKKLRGQSTLSEENITEALRDVRRAFLEADVNFTVTREFVKAVKEEALGADVLSSVSPGQMIVKIIHDQLAKVLGGTAQEINFGAAKPFVILMAGLQGSGKTTFSAKLSLFLRQKKKRTPLLVACDVYRPAAIKQLQVLGKSLDIPVFEEGLGNPVEIAKNGLKYAKENNFDLVIFDTAGRLQVDDELMEELKNIKAEIKPNETFFVADAMIGQEAVNVAKTFHDEIGFSGVCLSKMDGDARGGAALSILKTTGIPVRFIGTGERTHQFEVFHPDRMADRILGMGDVVSLVERAQEVIDEKEAKSLTKKIMNNKFDLNDFLNQLRTIKKLGPLKDIMGMIPGLNKMGMEQINDKELIYVEAILSSMTIKERERPNILNGSRRKRIANGSGTTVQRVNQVIKQFDEMKKMMKGISQMTKTTRGRKNLKGMTKDMSGLFPGSGR
jgi:signal recognition particle subunit SRP54